MVVQMVINGEVFTKSAGELIGKLHPKNPRIGDVDAIAESIRSNGFYGVVVVQKSTGYILAGNHRVKAAFDIDPEFEVPVTAVDVTDDKAMRILLADNRTSDLGTYDLKMLIENLSEVQDFGGTGYDQEDLVSLLHDLSMATPQEKEKKKGTGIRPSTLDIWFTTSLTCFGDMMLAKGIGWGVGTQSSKSTTQKEIKDHLDVLKIKPGFIDNEYHNYDHALHLETAKLWNPKYTTTRDIMTKKQCADAGIAYYSIEQILEWAEELSEHAENVILIPKYDCIDRLPEKFVMGYSVESSYGKTPLPLSAFKGRRVHLLGGNWKRQRAAIEEIPEEIVSLDNNHLMKIATFGAFYGEDGKEPPIQSIGLERHGRQVCIALSLTRIRNDLDDIYSNQQDTV